MSRIAPGIHLLVIRHGNTFDPGDTLLRVGAGTDLPLSNSGQVQAQQLGESLKACGLLPQTVFCSPLQRTQQTANIALNTAQHAASINILDWLTEIDYGPDEGQPEDQVMARIGQSTLDRWEQDNQLPEGWHLDIPAIQTHWRQSLEHFHQLACHQQQEHPTQVIWMVTSNGIARFVLDAIAQADWPDRLSSKKLKTGAYGHFYLDRDTNDHWQCLGWNIKPSSQETLLH